MAIDEVPVQEGLSTEPNPGSGDGLKFVVIFLVLAALAVGEFFTVNRMNTLRDQLTTQQNQLREDLTGQLRNQVSNRLTAIEQQNAQELDAVKTELDASGQARGRAGRGIEACAHHGGATSGSADATKRSSSSKSLPRRPTQQQVGALTQDVSSTKTDLDTTKKNVSTLASDLGMARSEMGTLIARNHDDIEYLRKLGDRDYFEFTLTKNQPAKVAGVGLTLKKTNPKRYQIQRGHAGGRYASGEEGLHHQLTRFLLCERLKKALRVSGKSV